MPVAVNSPIKKLVQEPLLFILFTLKCAELCGRDLVSPGKLYGSGPDPFPPSRNKRERVGYARLVGTKPSSFGLCEVLTVEKGCLGIYNIAGIEAF